jgi:hypothetical protein
VSAATAGQADEANELRSCAASLRLLAGQAPELADPAFTASLYLDALTTLRDVLLRDGDHLAARRHALQVIDSLGLPS